MHDPVTEKTNDLNNMQCRNLTSDELALSNDQAGNYVSQLKPLWHLNKNDNNISHTFNFKNYYQTIAFVNVIAQIAHQQDHHPELQISYNCCTVCYSTHSVNGLSLNDFICAAKINAAIIL